jgi:quercetin dioxygenase-like cupin family protein
MANDTHLDDIVPITGRRLALPAGRIFALQRAADADYELGAFRAWAGYRDLGCNAATDGLALFQHVICFAEQPGRTGVHCHLAHVHIVIPTSGRGDFSYDGVVTEMVPGDVIVQHGGTVHDQFAYSYVPASPEETKRTPVSLEPTPPDAPPQSFGFLELFVPRTIADVEIVPPAEVTPADEATAWDHPYHAAGASFFLQSPSAPTAAYHPVAGRPDLEARDCHTWAPTNELVATWIVRSAAGGSGREISLDLPGEVTGLTLVFVASGSATVQVDGGVAIVVGPGDALTATGQEITLAEPSPDLRLVLFKISARAEALRERTPDEIARLKALGPAIVTRRVVRPAHDDRPVNFLRDEDEAPI